MVSFTKVNVMRDGEDLLQNKEGLKRYNNQMRHRVMDYFVIKDIVMKSDYSL